MSSQTDTQIDRKSFTNCRLTLDEALIEVDRIFTLFMCNQHIEAVAECDRLIDEHFYFHVLRSIFKGLEAVITLEDEALSDALNVTKNALTILDPLRKKRSTFSRYFSWSGPNYNTDYIDEQIHAEGSACVMSALASVLTLLSEKTFTGLFRAGLWCKNAFDGLRECKLIAQKRTIWQSKESEASVKLGVQFGFALFNLIFSMLPSRIVRLFKWVGWPADRMKAFYLLKKISDARIIWSPFAAIVLLGYNLFLEFYAGLGNPDMILSTNLLNDYTKRYPNSAFLYIFEGSINQLNGKPDEAIKLYLKSVEIFNRWIEWKNLCYWLIAWCHCVKFEWIKALEYTEILVKTCPWSPCIFTYQYAALLKMQLDETLDINERIKLQNQIDHYLTEAPKLKRPFVGRTIYFEKFVTKRCQIYSNERSSIIDLDKCVNVNNSTCDSGIYDLNTNDISKLKKVNDDAISSKKDDDDDDDDVMTNEIDNNDDGDASMNDNFTNYKIVNQTYQTDDALILPILDLFLFWNIYLTFKYDPIHANDLLNRIELKLSLFNYENVLTREKYLYLTLMKGIIYKSIGNIEMAINCLTFVLDNEEYLQFYQHLPPHASLELGILCCQIDEYQLAEKYLNKSMNDYSHYLNETQVHIRAHSALSMMKAQLHQLPVRRSSNLSIRSITSP